MNHPTAIHAGDLPTNYFHLVSQDALTFTRFPSDRPHNSLWDFSPGPGGRMFVALCAELTAPLSAQLFEFHWPERRLEFLMDAGQVTLHPPAAIPPSKLHSSLHATRDGKMIMTTHTTARAPGHRFWLFESYYAHQWEGFPGSHVLEWDPAHRQGRTLGVPVPRDSIYGAMYDDRYHALWFTTFLRGHLYRLDLTTNRLEDFGQITEFASFRLAKDRLGNIYVSSRSGHLFHIEVATRRIRDIGRLNAEADLSPLARSHRPMAFYTNGPDGRLWIAPQFGEFFYIVDPETRRMERSAHHLPPDRRHNTPEGGVTCLTFDSQGVLWYGRWQLPHWAGCVHLMRWDVLGGGLPECVGLLGTLYRATHTITEGILDSNDIWHLADCNHAEDPPGILSVDLRKAAAGCGCASTSVPSLDPNPYLAFAGGEQRYPGWPASRAEFETRSAGLRRVIAEDDQLKAFLARQANSTVPAAVTRAVRVWEHLPFGESAVQWLAWNGPNELLAWCGADGRHRVRVRSGIVTEVGPRAADELPPCDAEPPPAVRAAALPYRQCRQFMAQPSCWVPWGQQHGLVGTADGLLAKVDLVSGDCFGLGAVAPHGPVRQLVVTPDGQRAFGIAGSERDLGHLFCYDDRCGLRELGRTKYFPVVGDLGGPEPVFCNSEPSCLAVSPDGRTLAVGTRDQLACVYLFTDIEIGEASR